MSGASPDLAEVCRGFFDAIERRDLEAVGARIARGAVMCRNGGQETPLRLLAHPRVAELTHALLGRHRYEDIRMVVGDGVVVEQHRVRSTTPSGRDIDTDVCAVLQVDTEGLITRLDEYTDLALEQ